MIQYTPESQLSIDLFETPFKASLSPDNRWVKLSKVVPWDKFASIYMKKMNSGFGRPGLSPRMVLGALIIKHIEKLDDRGVIASIQENIYMQYFIGLKGFQTEPIFDPSLFVEIRKRIGSEDFDELNVTLIKSVSAENDKKHIQNSKKRRTKKDEDQPQNRNKDTTEKEIANADSNRVQSNTKETLPPNKGKLQLDATVADQYITYPTDTKLLNQSRKQCEKIIDTLHVQLREKDSHRKKPRTYRRKLNKLYLEFSKKRRKSRSQIRKTNRQLLEALKRDISHINKMLDEFKGFPLTQADQKMLWIVSLVYQQQKYMYDNKTNSIPYRIVSIFQPYVRPIPRGKERSQIEFGSKLGVSLDDGLARIDTLSWEAYNEGGDFIKQVEAYRYIHGYYPDLVQVDKIYATKKNRAWAKERGIRITAEPLGRKRTKNKESYYYKRKRKKEATERNRIEGKFGQGKNAYELNRIRARLQNTSESWIAAIFFIMNLIHLEKAGYFLSNFCKQILYLLISTENMIIQTTNISCFSFTIAGSKFNRKNY